jgi:hypothetical protein
MEQDNQCKCLWFQSFFVIWRQQAARRELAGTPDCTILFYKDLIERAQAEGVVRTPPPKDPNNPRHFCRIRSSFKAIRSSSFRRIKIPKPTLEHLFRCRRSRAGRNTFGTFLGGNGTENTPDVFRHDNCEQLGT